MRRITATLSAVAIALSAVAGVLAQAKPDFSGKWTLEAPAGGGAPGGGGRGGRGGFGGGGGWGMNPTLTQTATTLTVEYTTGGQNPTPVKLEYKLDGSESKNTVTMGRGGAQEQVAKATWEGDKLKIVTTTQFGEQTRVVSLAGGKLVIETTLPGREGGAPVTTSATYSKS